MRRLLLLRHAKSDWATATADRERPLAARGRAAAPLMGGYLARHALAPDRVLVSPARRTRETWDLAAGALPGDRPRVVEDRIYEAGTGLLFDLVLEQPDDAHSVLIVGHNPGLHDLALELVASGDSEARERLGEKFPTGALAVIDFAIDAWADIHLLSGRLDRFIVPKMLGLRAD